MTVKTIGPPLMSGWFPKLSPDGRYVATGSGAGGGVYDFNTGKVVRIGTAYGCCWLSPTELVFSTGGEVFKAVAPAFVPELLLSQGTNWIAAGGGHWTASTASKRLPFFLDGKVFKEGVYHGCAMEGSGLFVTTSNGGRNVLVFNPDGTLKRQFTTLHSTDVLHLGANGYVGHGYFGPSWVNTPEGEEVEVGVTPERRESPPLPFLYRNEVWLATSNDTSVFLRPLGEKAVITVPLPGGCTDIAVVGDQFRVVGNTTRGVMTAVTVDANTPRKALTTALPPVYTAGIRNPLWVGYFFSDSARYGSNDKAPGNCSVVVEAGLKPKKPVIIPPALIDEYRTRWKQVVAIYVTSESPGGLKADCDRATNAMRLFGLPDRPLLSYTSTPLQLTPEVDWVGVECYPLQGETSAQALVRWKAELNAATAAKKPIAIIGAAYDRLGTISLLTLAECQILYHKLAQNFDVRALLWFSDGRGGGTRDHEELRPYHVATAAAAKAPRI